MAVLFDEGSWVWIPDETENSLPGKVLATFQSGQDGKVRTENGEDHWLTTEATKVLKPADPEVLDPKIDDLIMLNDHTNEAILHNLRIRFKQDIIYTNVSSICLSVNPFKMLPLYTPELMDKYYDDPMGQAPHVFKVADDAYKTMMRCSRAQPAMLPREYGAGKQGYTHAELRHGISQSVVVSGESGAGKTEACKQVMQYLTHLSKKGGIKLKRIGECSGNVDSEPTGGVEANILKCNPILEAFGNAKTARNDNSSRFGKFIRIHYGANGQGSRGWTPKIIGSSLEHYLLETSRISSQSPTDRNYHIFFQLVEGASAEQRSMLKLTPPFHKPGKFRYLGQVSTDLNGLSGVTESRATMKLTEAFIETINALGHIEVSKEATKSVMRIIAAVLHIGNITFRQNTDSDSTAPLTPEALKFASDLLGCTDLLTAMTSRTIRTGTGGKRSSMVRTSLNVQQSVDGRDVLAKALYGATFDWLVAQCNRSLQVQYSHRVPFIGILDIFGFENFEINSFEQLCINYCNERLQSFFNRIIFEGERQFLKAEGIDSSTIVFEDNATCVELIEMKPEGILPILRDLNTSGRESDDSTFFKQMVTAHGDKSNQPHPNFLVDVRSRRGTFVVKHFAANVTYDTKGFIDKNNNNFSDDLRECMQNSSEPFTRALFRVRSLEDGASRKKPPKKTVGEAFQEQLTALDTTLQSTTPHFVRCIKPNTAKHHGIFESRMVFEQLVCTGVMSLINTRKDGWPRRETWQSLWDIFVRDQYCEAAGLNPLTDPRVGGQAILAYVDPDLWQEGKTTVFLKDSVFPHLKLWRVHYLATLVQKNIRMVMAVLEFRKLMRRIRVLQLKAIRFLMRLRYKQDASQAMFIQAWVRMIQWRYWWRNLRHEAKLKKDFTRLVTVLLVGPCMRIHIQRLSSTLIQNRFRGWFWRTQNKKRRAARSIQCISRKRNAYKCVESVRIRKNFASFILSNALRMMRQRRKYLRFRYTIISFQVYYRWKVLWCRLRTKKISMERARAATVLQRCWSTIKLNRMIRKWSELLHAAISWGDIKAVKDLIQCKDPPFKSLQWMKSKINIRDAAVGFKTFMQTAVSCKPIEVEIIQALLNEDSCCLDYIDAAGNSLLHTCAESGDAAIVGLKCIANRLISKLDGSLTANQVMKFMYDTTMAEGAELTMRESAGANEFKSEGSALIKADTLTVDSDSADEFDGNVSSDEAPESAAHYGRQAEQLYAEFGEIYADERDVPLNEAPHHGWMLNKFSGTDSREERVYRRSIRSINESELRASLTVKKGLSPEAFKAVVQQVHVARSKMRMNEDQLQEAFEGADLNRDGIVDKVEFTIYYAHLRRKTIRKARQERSQLKQMHLVRAAEAEFTRHQTRRIVERQRLSNLTVVTCVRDVENSLLGASFGLGMFTGASRTQVHKLRRFINRMNALRDTALDIALERGAGRTASYLFSMGCTSYHVGDKNELRKVVATAEEKSKSAGKYLRLPAQKLPLMGIPTATLDNLHLDFFTTQSQPKVSRTQMVMRKKSAAGLRHKFTPSARARREAYLHNVKARKLAEGRAVPLDTDALKPYGQETLLQKQDKAHELAALDLKYRVTAMIRRISAYRQHQTAAILHRGWYYKESGANDKTHGLFQAADMKKLLREKIINHRSLVCFGETSGLWFEVRHLFPPNEGAEFDLEIEKYRNDLLLLDSYVLVSASNSQR